MTMTQAETRTDANAQAQPQASCDIQYKPLHPTFVAEASGVDLTRPTPELVSTIKEGLAKVRDPDILFSTSTFWTTDFSRDVYGTGLWTGGKR